MHEQAIIVMQLLMLVHPEPFCLHKLIVEKNQVSMMPFSCTCVQDLNKQLLKVWKHSEEGLEVIVHQSIFSQMNFS